MLQTQFIWFFLSKNSCSVNILGGYEPCSLLFFSSPSIYLWNFKSISRLVLVLFCVQYIYIYIQSILQRAITLQGKVTNLSLSTFSYCHLSTYEFENNTLQDYVDTPDGRTKFISKTPRNLFGVGDKKLLKVNNKGVDIVHRNQYFPAFIEYLK